MGYKIYYNGFLSKETMSHIYASVDNKPFIVETSEVVDAIILKRLFADETFTAHYENCMDR